MASCWLIDRCGVESIFVAGKKAGMTTALHDVPLVPFERDHYLITRLVWFDILRYAIKSDILLFAAGSIFSIAPFFLVWLTLRCLRLIRGGRLRIIALGVSVGPLRDAISHRWCPKLFDLMDFAMLRDQASERLLRDLGSGVPLSVSYDLALAWPPAWQSKPPHTSTLRVGVSLHSAAWSSDEQARALMDAIVEALGVISPAFPDLAVTVFTVCSDPKDGDARASRELVERLAGCDVEVRLCVYGGTSPEEFAAEIQSCRALVTSRMHAGIIAMTSAVPVLQIAYARKVVDFFAHCELGSDFLVPPTHVATAVVKNFIRLALGGEIDVPALQRQARLKLKREAVLVAMERCAREIVSMR